MAERRTPTDQELERALRALGSSLAYPPTPPLAAPVGARIRAGAPRPWLVLPRRRLVALVAVGLLLAGGAAVAAGLAIGAIGFRAVPTLPPGTPPPAEEGPALGEPTTLVRARAAVDFPVLVPALLGPPDRVFLDRGPLGDRVVLAWRPREGLPRIGPSPFGAIVMEIGRADGVGVKEVAFKELRPAEAPTFLEVDGHEGAWIRGEHDLVLRTEEGEVRYRVSGRVLIWTDGRVTYRLETMLSRAEALALAGSFR